MDVDILLQTEYLPDGTQRSSVREEISFIIGCVKAHPTDPKAAKIFLDQRRQGLSGFLM